MLPVCFNAGYITWQKLYTMQNWKKMMHIRWNWEIVWIFTPSLVWKQKSQRDFREHGTSSSPFVRDPRGALNPVLNQADRSAKAEPHPSKKYRGKIFKTIKTGTCILIENFHVSWQSSCNHHAAIQNLYFWFSRSSPYPNRRKTIIFHQELGKGLYRPKHSE